MQEQPPHALLRISDDETVVQSAEHATERAKVCSPKRAVTDSGPHLTKETEVVLRVRLRPVALMLLIGFGAFFIRHVVGALTGEPLFRGLMAFHVLVVVVLTLVAGPLWRYWEASIKRLRIAELIIFGLPAAFLSDRATLEWRPSLGGKIEKPL